MIDGMRAIFEEQGVPATVQQAGPMWQVFFGLERPVTRVRQSIGNDTAFYERFQSECQTRGVYFHNGWHERWFSSTAHTQAEVDESLAVIEQATKAAKGRVLRPAAPAGA